MEPFDKSKVANTRLSFCSIASSSHYRQALTSLLSLRAQHPNAALYLLCVDFLPPLPDGIRALSLADCIPAAVLSSMRKRYGLAELCFAAKPFLLARILDESLDQAHYIDGDCLGFARFDPMVQQLANADLLLTPHSLSPIPDDGMTPRPLTLLRSGVFNGGYLGVRNTAQGKAFLAWLSSITQQYAYNAPKEGMCGDQRWLDLVPVLFPGAAICRHPGANVAYWNLHERRLQRHHSGQLTVNDEPLLFFHFSGFNIDKPTELSRHQNRHEVLADSPLAALLQIYCQQLNLQPCLTSDPVPSLRRRFKWRS